MASPPAGAPLDTPRAMASAQAGVLTDTATTDTEPADTANTDAAPADAATDADAPCLAAALWDDVDSPQQYTTPTAWRQRFLRHHADAAVYAGLFGCSRLGQQWALTNAPKVTVTLRPPSEPDAAWQRQVQAVHQALAIRGRGRYSGLKVLCDQGCALDTIPDELLMCGLISSLALQAADWRSSRASSGFGVAAFLHCAASPSLTSLQLDSVGHGLLPPPTILPNLTSLSLTASVPDSQTAATLASIASYVPQLHTLHLALYLLDLTPPWTRIFTSDAPYLTNFSTNDTLTDHLLGFLLDRAPRLQRLGVGCLALGGDRYRGRVWGVGEIGVDRDQGVQGLSLLPTYKANGLECQSVCHTEGPVCRESGSVCDKGGPVVVRWDVGRGAGKCVMTLPVGSEQGLNSAFVQRLPEWVIMCDYVDIFPRFSLRERMEAEALGCVLQQLRDMKAPTARINLKRWSWTSGMLRAVSNALPTLNHLHIVLHYQESLVEDTFCYHRLQDLMVASLDNTQLSFERVGRNEFAARSLLLGRP